MPAWSMQAPFTTAPAKRSRSSPESCKMCIRDRVWAEAEITAVSENGKMVDFAVKAWDESGPIGSGTHTRAIVKNEKFLAKCNAKLEKK